ncbi:hypothetical protein HN018_28305 (plasmid) [Lichenicola cladoniae]|uniref:Uncharacterized protein n=1 Tax=Lichenicola cladoniae TaxID=1484109 RepID=A0A6M8HZR9_9PROT|nr:hypothetical protein [Lichenicola cladoniae]NPD69798.1 hypothetical protein [Acetobacteraceae bacterium]QKE94029.1 hypothetical protein HN018_28305 [Lichenicola cladoniae]
MADARQTSQNHIATWDAPMVGSVLIGPGIASYVRIPVPGTQGLILSLRPPPHWHGSTSAIFIRNPEDARYGKPFLRLDYGPNKSTHAIDYHWNIEGKAARKAFPGITNHMPAGATGEAIYKGAKAFRAAGRVFIITGAVLDGISILTANRPWQRTLQVVTAWEAATVLANQAGKAGAAVGTMIEPGAGTMIGGGIGAIVGGFVGYYTASTVAGVFYNWAENTHFIPAHEIAVPSQ